MLGVFITMSATTYAQKPEMVVQTGLTDPVDAVAYSPDGRTLASSGWSNSVELWDVTSGTELRTLNGHESGISSVAFSPDGRMLASGSWDTTSKLWDVSTGEVLQNLDAFTSAVISVAFSPDGMILATGEQDNKVALWQVSTGKLLRTLNTGSEGVLSVAFSPDGSTLVAGTSSPDGIRGDVILWTVSTGTELRRIKDQPGINSVAFSPDGKTLVGACGDTLVRVWSIATGIELRSLKGHSGKVSAVAFRSDGNMIATSSADHTIKLWDFSTGAELRTLVGHMNVVESVTFSRDGKTIVSGSADNTIKFWDVATGTELYWPQRHATNPISIAFSPDGKILACAATDNTVRLWDIATGKIVRSLSGKTNGGSPVVFSKDGKTLASGSVENTVKIWDVATGIELRTLRGHTQPVRSLAFSPDGSTVAGGGEDNTVWVWNASTGAIIRVFGGYVGGVADLAFSPDGKTLVSGGLDNAVKLWNLTSGVLVRTFQPHSDTVEANGGAVSFSPDGRILAGVSYANYESTVVLWDARTGLVLHTLRGHDYPIDSVAFSSDGKILASASMDHAIKLWNVSTGLAIQTLTGHSDQVYSVAFSVSNTYLASGGDRTIRIWEVNSGRELASLVEVDSNDWVVTTADGLFDGSPSAWSSIIWRFNHNTFDYAPAEAFFSDFYYPGLLSDIFSGKHPKAPSDISRKDRRQPHLSLAQAQSESGATLPTRNVSLKIGITEALAGAQDVRLFRNGSLVKLWSGDALKGKPSVTLNATIPIAAGENRLTAYAFNHDNIKSADATLTVTGADSLKHKGTAYIVAVGVNEYANAQYNLKYAVADAQDFATEVRAKQEALGQYEHVEVVTLVDRDASKEKIIAAINGLKTKVQPEDAVIIYFSGHGVAAGNRFYLVPHDLGYTGARKQLDQTGLNTILAHSISDEELQAAVEGIDAGQMLMVIDACNSGQALEAEEKRRGPMNSKGLAQLAYEKGMYILTAAQSYQAALEASKLGHGYLTYALVEEGLKTAVADIAPKDGSVLLREWLDYATTRVPAMQQEKLNQGVPAPDQPAPTTPEGRRSLQEVTVTFTNGEENVDPAQRTLQRPRVFYRREVEPQPLIIARP
jgi:WD40 repeat protein